MRYNTLGNSSIGPICSSTNRFICEAEVICFKFSRTRLNAVETA
jgi:hypothetical protein